MRITNPSEIPKFVRDAANQSANVRSVVAQITSRDMCYYLGRQLYGNTGTIRNRDTGNLRTDYNPDSTHLRVTDNETTANVLMSAAATDPSNVEVQINPPPRDAGVEQMVKAQAQEDAVNSLLTYARFKNRCKDANLNRCIMGAQGIGWRMAVGKKSLQVNGQSMNTIDRILSCFTFHPLRLILDPYNPARDLRDHDWVIYEDVWTIDMLRRYYPGVDWASKENDMVTVGNLATNEITAYEVTGRNVFQQYAQQSQTKGARVYQVHIKDDNDRFSQMWCGYSLGPKYDVEVVNADDPSTPFGGDGLPLAMLYGNYKPESPVGISDVGMMRDKQDKLNLTETWQHRIVRKYAGYQWIVDKRWFGRNVNDSDIQDKFSNEVAGIITGDPKSADRTVQPPQLMTTPQPANIIQDMQDRYRAGMSDMVSRPSLTQGKGLKSHQSGDAIGRVIAEADRIPGLRVEGDIAVYQQLALVGLGTLAGLVQKGNPSTLAMLRREGFDESDIGHILDTDSSYPACQIIIPESSIRRRSVFEKKTALESAASLQQITPAQFMQGMADLDLAVTNADAHMRTTIQRWVAEVIRGAEWEPLPLGEYSSALLTEFRKGYGDRRVRFDPEAKARVTRAIHGQEQLALIQRQQQAMAENPPAQAPAEATPPEQPQPTNIAEMISMMSGQAA